MVVSTNPLFSSSTLVTGTPPGESMMSLSTVPMVQTEIETVNKSCGGFLSWLLILILIGFFILLWWGAFKLIFSKHQMMLPNYGRSGSVIDLIRRGATPALANQSDLSNNPVFQQHLIELIEKTKCQCDNKNNTPPPENKTNNPPSNMPPPSGTQDLNNVQNVQDALERLRRILARPT